LHVQPTLALAFAALLGWSTAPGVRAQPPLDAEAIRRARALSNAAIARHDTAGIAATMMSDVQILTSTSDHVDGRDQYMRRFAAQFQQRPDVRYVRTPDSVAVYQAWGMASESGRWEGQWTEPRGRVRIGGAYFAKWQKAGSAWRIQSEVFVPHWCQGTPYCEERPR
jgi:ketosteroid isomerase-like protein